MTIPDMLDKAAVAGVGAAWINLLPPVLEIVVLVLTIIWFALRIYESETIKRWRGK